MRASTFRIIASSMLTTLLVATVLFLTAVAFAQGTVSAGSGLSERRQAHVAPRDTIDIPPCGYSAVTVAVEGEYVTVAHHCDSESTDE